MTKHDVHSHRFKGSMVAIVTPMHSHGGIDYASMESLIEWHIQEGSDGIVVAGTTGEASTLEDNELYELVKFSVGVAGGRLPVIGGSGSNSTLKAIKLSKLVQQAGADACLVVSPYYNKPTQAGLIQHYQAIADSLDIPVILYNVPGRTSSDISVETTLKLAAHPNIVAIKEANASPERIQEITSLAGDAITLISGDDASCADFILHGGHGFISVTANVVPRAMKELLVAALAGDKSLSRELDAKIASLHRDLFIESNPSPVKWALMRMGKLHNGIRLPLIELSQDAQVIVENSLRQANVI